MTFTAEKMEDLRADAIAEMMLDDQYEAHEEHYDFPQADCWLCTERAEDE